MMIYFASCIIVGMMRCRKKKETAAHSISVPDQMCHDKEETAHSTSAHMKPADHDYEEYHYLGMN